MADDSFQDLTAKVDELIDLCAAMKRENQALKAQKASLKSQQQDLVDKNQQAKGKLQSILERLRTMDKS